MRFALVPRSLLPTRDTERTSMRLPAGAGATRITTSSRKPNHGVVAVASMRPAAASAAAISQPMPLAASSARANASAGGSGSSSG